MRVAMITPGFSSHDEDPCIPVLRALARDLNRHIELRVYTTCHPPRSGRYSVQGVPVSAFGDGGRSRLAWYRRQRRTVRALDEDHRHSRFDVVHGWWADGGGIAATLFGRRHRLPVIVTVMGGELVYEPESGYGKRRRLVAGGLARFGARRADALNVSSPWHADRIRATHARLHPEVIVLGADTGRFNANGTGEILAGALPVLSVASLVPVKGHGTLLRALAAARARVPGLHLHLVGAGPERAALEALAADLGVRDALTLHGAVDHAAMPAYYRGAAFCVLASHFENHGMVSLEAAACGRATIGSAVGLLPELVPADLLSRPGDWQALADSLCALAEDSGLRQRVAQDMARRVRSRYSLDATVEAFARLYARVQHT